MGDVLTFPQRELRGTLAVESFYGTVVCEGVRYSYVAALDATKHALEVRMWRQSGEDVSDAVMKYTTGIAMQLIARMQEIGIEV